MRVPHLRRSVWRSLTRTTARSTTSRCSASPSGRSCHAADDTPPLFTSPSERRSRPDLGPISARALSPPLTQTPNIFNPKPHHIRTDIHARTPRHPRAISAAIDLHTFPRIWVHALTHTVIRHIPYAAYRPLRHPTTINLMRRIHANRQLPQRSDIPLYLSHDDAHDDHDPHRRHIMISYWRS